MTERENAYKIRVYENRICELRDEKKHLINVIDELDNSRINIKVKKDSMIEVFSTRLASFDGLSIYHNKSVVRISKKLKEYNSIHQGNSYVYKAIETIQCMLEDVNRNIEKRVSRMEEIDLSIRQYNEKIEALRH